MNNFFRVGNQVLNPAHIVRAEFEPAEPGGVEMIDPDTQEHWTSRPKQARLTITLSSVELEQTSEDHSAYSSGAFHLAAASVSQVVTLHDYQAKDVWECMLVNSVDTIGASQVPAEE